MLAASTARHHQPGRRPVRAERRALHHDRHAVAAAFLRPRRRPEEGLRLDLPFLLGRWRTSSACSPACGDQLPDQQGGRRRSGRTIPTAMPGATRKMGFPPVLRAQGLQAGGQGPLPVARRRFLGLSSPSSRRAGVEIVTGVVPPPDFANFWVAGRPAGLQAEDRHRRQGARNSPPRSRPSASAATASRSKCGGRRPIPSAPA